VGLCLNDWHALQNNQMPGNVVDIFWLVTFLLLARLLYFTKMSAYIQGAFCSQNDLLSFKVLHIPQVWQKLSIRKQSIICFTCKQHTEI
jgi:hypothetical protein